MNKEIRKALNSAVETIAQALATPETPIAVLWENITAQALRNDTLYLEPYLLPAATQFTGFQQTARIYSGVFQVTLIVPADTGTQFADEYADGIVDSSVWRSIKIGTRTLQLTDAPHYSAMLEDGDKVRIPITVPYMLCA